MATTWKVGSKLEGNLTGRPAQLVGRRKEEGLVTVEYADNGARQEMSETVLVHAFTLVSRPEVEPQEPEWVTRERQRLPQGWTLTATGRPLLGSTEPLYTLRAPCGRAPDMGAHLASADMGHDGVVRWVKQAADDLGLPDPYAPQEPPITLEGDAAVLPVPETEPPDSRADWVCERCGEDDLDNGAELCGWCEAEDAVEAERKANPQRMPDFDGQLNELGFPRMPSQPFLEHVRQMADASFAAMAITPAQAGVRPIPLDCFLRDREAVRVWSEKLDAKHEAERAGPCIGDLVTAWYQEESKVPTRLTGVVVEMDDRFISLRRLGRYDVCLREGAEVVTRKEQL
jgi:hypothetical protein